MAGRRDAALLEASVKTRLLDTRRHLAALEAAVAAFGDGFDAVSFERAWRSDQPEELHRSYLVQAGCENVINAVVQAGRELCELKGWLAGGAASSSVDVLRVLHENGVVDAQVRRELRQVQELRSRVQHDYANVEGRRVYEAVLLVLDAAPRMIQDAVLTLRGGSA